MVKYLYPLALVPVVCLSQDNWIAKDKAQHFTGSAVIAYSLTEVMSPTKAFITTVGIGAAKELYDYKNPDKHTASYKDFIWDVAGAYVGVYAKGYSFDYTQKTFVVRYTINLK